MQYSILLAALCASSALAVNVTSPGSGDTWSASSSNTITWTSVSSDPTTIDITLVNMQVNPPVTETIASNVKTSDGSYTVKGSSLQGAGQGYQINLMGTGENAQAILGQSKTFSLAAGSSSSSASSASTASTASTGSSSSTLSAAASSSTASTASIASTASTASTASAASTDSTASVASTSGSASAASTGSTASTASKATGSTSATGSTTASSTGATTSPSSAANINAISAIGLGLGGLLALLA